MATTNGGGAGECASAAADEMQPGNLSLTHLNAFSHPSPSIAIHNGSCHLLRFQIPRCRTRLLRPRPAWSLSRPRNSTTMALRSRNKRKSTFVFLLPHSILVFPTHFSFSCAVVCFHCCLSLFSLVFICFLSFSCTFCLLFVLFWTRNLVCQKERAAHDQGYLQAEGKVPEGRAGAGTRHVIARCSYALRAERAKRNTSFFLPACASSLVKQKGEKQKRNRSPWHRPLARSLARSIDRRPSSRSSAPS